MRLTGQVREAVRVMELPLVVGVDGSDSSLRALDWASGEAVLHSCELRLVHASLWERYEGRASDIAPDQADEHELAEQIVRSAAARATQRHPSLKIATTVLPEEPADALLNEARNAAALVTGQRGRGPLRGLLLGSVSLAVASRAACPVIVVRGSDAGVGGSHGRVLLGVGDVDSHGAAIRFAYEEAEMRRCVLDAVRTWRCPSYETTDHPRLVAEPAHLHAQHATELLADALRSCARAHPDVPVRTSTVEGPARKILVDRSAAADLLVIGARRRHGHFGLQLGRVGHASLHHADCPVAVVPQHGS